ncbi:MAG TPA: hypothetical protein VN814_05995 [Caulobacteraceae bacterium]|nr:hypothetical protein [Caulobacteraceae bacterium]
MSQQPSTELAAFLHGEIDARDFRHADHVRMAFEVLARHSFLDAAMAVSSALKAMARRAGNPGAYHETITLAFLAVIGERCATGGFRDYEEFAAANPDLLDKTVLARWYGPDKLGGETARRTFVLPDPLR